MVSPLRGTSGIVDEGNGRVQAPGPGVMPTVTGAGEVGGASLGHVAFPYRGTDEYLANVLPFITGGLAEAEPVLIAVPGGLARQIRAALPAGWAPAVADMDELGRNPARITLALAAFAGEHPGRPVRCVTELMWPGRTRAEAAEVEKHEALVNVALAGVPAQVLCPYDAAGLTRAAIARAGHTHPLILARGQRGESRAYRAQPGSLAEDDLPPPPASAEFLAYTTQLHSVRVLVSRYAEHAGLSADRSADLILAVSELTANTLSHTSGGGTVHIWTSRQHLVCQVHDSGWITDPLAGRRRPPPGAPGQGLWVVNHVCDLVEMRTGPTGTTTRLRMRLDGPAALPPGGFAWSR